jgi:hypothetical protein
LSEEILGPVAPVIPFDTEEEVVRMATDTPFGLAGYLFTQDLDGDFRVGEELEVGMVGLNTGVLFNPVAPFGGIKASGLGREGGRMGIGEFLEYRYMADPAGLIRWARPRMAQPGSAGPVRGIRPHSDLAFRADRKASHMHDHGPH